MNITIRNIRSLESAELNGGGITLVTGPNTSGKTSLINAISAAMLGDAKIYGATKANPGPVVREGADTASCRVTSGVQEYVEDGPEGISLDTWARGIVWPFDGDVIEHGVAPPADVITMGRVDPAADFDKKAWADYIRTICGKDAAVKWPEVQAALEQQKPAPVEPILEVKEALKTAGWDGTATMCANRAKDARRSWEKATGDNFGSTKSDWVHEHYRDGDDATALESEITKAEAELARAKAAGDIAHESADKLQAEIAGYQEQIHDLEANIALTQKDRDAIDKELAKFPRGDQLVCPCCGEHLSLVGSKLEVAVEYDAQAKASLAERADSQTEAIRNKRSLLGTAQAKLEAAQSMLKKVGDGQGQSPTVEMAVIQHKADDLHQRKYAQLATQLATEHFAAWSFWTHAADVTGPLGVRYKATQRAVEQLQPKLNEIAQKIFPEHQVEIRAEENGLGLYFDGYDYKSMVWNGDPNSYKLGIQIMFQVLHAEQLSPDAPILIDRADTLDRRRLSGVLNCLVTRKRQAIIAKTVGERPEADKLKAAGVGATYYINNGMVEAV